MNKAAMHIPTTPRPPRPIHPPTHLERMRLARGRLPVGEHRGVHPIQARAHQSAQGLGRSLWCVCVRSVGKQGFRRFTYTSSLHGCHLVVDVLRAVRRREEVVEAVRDLSWWWWRRRGAQWRRGGVCISSVHVPLPYRPTTSTRPRFTHLRPPAGLPVEGLGLPGREDSLCDDAVLPIMCGVVNRTCVCV